MIRIHISPLLILYIAISVCSDEYFATPLPPTLTWPHTKPGLSPNLHSSGLFWLFLVNNNWSTGKFLNWPEVTSGLYLHERTKHLGSGSLPRYLIIPLSSVSQYHWPKFIEIKVSSRQHINDDILLHQWRSCIPGPNQVGGERLTALTADNSSLSVQGEGMGGEDCWHVGPGFLFWCHHQTK